MCINLPHTRNVISQGNKGRNENRRLNRIRSYPYDFEPIPTPVARPTGSDDRVGTVS